MRPERTVQASIFDVFAGHEIGRELKAMSAWLDDHRELAGLVAADLRRREVKATGRQGLPAEAVLRCGVLKQYRQLIYQELAFHLEDFDVVPGVRPAAACREPAVSRCCTGPSARSAPRSGSQINRTLLTSARETKLERGRVVRLDSTVTAALIHEPSDSSLLWDAVRVMVRLLREAERLAGRARLWWRDHRRAAKKRARDIQFTRGRPRRVPLYRELIRAHAGHPGLPPASGSAAGHPDWLGGRPGGSTLAGQGRSTIRPLIERVIAQASGASWRVRRWRPHKLERHVAHAAGLGLAQVVPAGVAAVGRCLPRRLAIERGVPASAAGARCRPDCPPR